MLIQNGDGLYLGGPLDVICILHNVEAGTYHAAFFEEAPMPGPVADVSEVKAVRLKSKMHRTEGRNTLEEAQADVDDLASKIKLAPENIWREQPQDWAGETGIVWVVPNWRKAA